MRELPSTSADQRLNLSHILDSHAFSGQQHNFSDFEEIQQTQNLSTSAPEFSESPFDFRGFRNDDEGANEPSDCGLVHFSNVGAGSLLRDLQHATGRSHCASLRGSTNSGEVSHGDTQRLEGKRGELQPLTEHYYEYNLQRLSSISDRKSALMQSPYPPVGRMTIAHGESQSPHHEPFGRRFRNPENAGHFRKVAMRFSRTPYRPPDEDPSIAAIASDRQAHVKRIYDAMTRPDAAKDNTNSIAMRRWVHGAHYPSDLVEAYAHKVFDCLLTQVQEGFRGWHHNDYASDDRKGEPEDKDVSCEERLENILRGLEEEKTICEDVMTSACQIRMFVNAPRAYARRKQANRHGNSKRGKTIPTKSELSSRVAKARRMTAKHTTRLRQPSPGDSNAADTSHRLQGTDPRLPKQLPQAPYYHASQRQQVSSPLLNNIAPQPTPFVAHSDSGSGPVTTPSTLHVTSMSPTQPHANIPHFTSSARSLQSSFLSPPTLYHNSAPISPDAEKWVNSAISSSWPPALTFGGPSHYMSPPLDPGLDLSFFQFDGPEQRSQSDGSVGQFEDSNEFNIDPAFRTYWDSQRNILPFSQEQSNDINQKS